MPDQEKFIAEMWPTTGPHTAESIISAAIAISELWRYLGHASQGYAAKINPLENLSDAYTLVGALAEADLRAADVLARLGHWATYIGDRSVDTQHYGITDSDGSPDQIQSLMNRVTAHIRSSAANHATAAERLSRAHSQLSFVYTNQSD